MSPKLTDHLKVSINEFVLLDPSLRGSPEEVNPWAVYCAWAFDWILAYVFVSLAVNAWSAFLSPLGMDELPLESTQLLTTYSQYLKLAMTPLVYLTISFVGISLNGMTPGLKIFKHAIQAHGSKEAALHAFASTVSLAAFGLPILNSWVDQFSFCETTSHHYTHWFMNYQQVILETPVNLVEMAQANEEWDQAA
jgi:hypothetical protein